MEPSATTILAGRLDSLARNSPVAAGLVRGHWVILCLGVTDQLLFVNGEAVQAECWPMAGHQGYYCAFTHSFMPEKLSRRIRRISVFAAPAEGVVKLSRGQAAAVSQIFELLLAEMGSKYPHKLDLMRTYVIQIIHFGLKNAGSAS